MKRSLIYDNRDSMKHNIVILESHTATRGDVPGDIFAGPMTSMFSVPALRPGTVAFHCELHPAQMRGPSLSPS